MASVDDRIVAMQFDNKVFEEKIATTVGSLDKLKGSLDFANSRRGMDDLSAAGRSFSLSGMAESLSDIGSRFSAMGAIAFTVLQNITNRALDASIKLVKALSLDQVMGGFQEYELKMGSIQTILANTTKFGTTLDDVNSAFNELNAYADKTIYNFGDMTKNIGLFTNAGIALEPAVSMIKGFSNAAAASGVSSQGAAGAAYQLSQAMSAGTIRLMDWKSLTNVGLGSANMRDSLVEIAVAMGTVGDAGTSAEEIQKNFNGSLEKGWLSADVMSNYLQIMAGDLDAAQIAALGLTEAQVTGLQAQAKTAEEAATKVRTFTALVGTVKESIGSGWADTFAIVLGDFTEATALFSSINDAIGRSVTKSTERRNELLQGWKDLGGRTVLIDALRSAFTSLGTIVTQIGLAFRSVFPAIESMDLYKLTVAFWNFTQALEPSNVTIARLRVIFKGFFSIISIGVEVIKGIIGVFGDLFSALTAGVEGDGILTWLVDISQKIISFRESLVDNGGIADFFQGISDKIVAFVSAVKATFTDMDTFVAKMKEIWGYFTGGIAGETGEGSGIMLFASNLGSAVGEIKATFTDMDTFVAKIKELWGYFTGGLGGETGEGKGLQLVASKLGEAVGSLKDRFFDLLDRFPALGKAFKVLSGFVENVRERFSWVGDIVRAVGNLFSWFGSQMDNIRSAFSTFGTFLKDTFGDIPAKIGEIISNGDYSTGLDTLNTGIFAGIALLVKQFLDGLDFGNGILDNISGAFESLTGVLDAMQTKLKAEALQKIAIAVGVLTASLLILSTMNSADLTKALTAMAVGFGQLVLAMALLNQIQSGPRDAAAMATLSGGLILLAGAILILSVAAKIMASMDLGELAKGLIGVSVLLGVMVLAANNIDGSGLVRAGIGMIGMAIAINIMALAVKSFAEMDLLDLGKGLLGVAVSLGLITVAANKMPSGMIGIGLGMIAIATALNIMALAVKSFAEMNLLDMGKGLLGVGASLVIIALAMKLMPKNLVLQGVGLLAVGVGLVAVAKAVTMMGDMSWSKLAKGLVGLAGALLILAGGLALMSSAIPGAIALGITALSLGALASALKEFGGVSVMDIVTALGALAAVMGVLGLGALALSSVIPAILALGVALGAVGVAFALFGAGAFLVATAFGIVASAGSAGVAVLLTALSGIIQLLPSLIVAIGDGLIQLVEKLVEAAPKIIAGLSEVLAALIQLIIDNVPLMGEAFRTIIAEFLLVLTESVPGIVAAGFAVLMAFLQGIRDNIAEIVTVVADIITNFLDALALKVPEIIDSVYNLIIAIIEGVIAKLADIAVYLVPKGLELLQGLWNGVTTKAKELYTWFTELPGRIVGWIGDILKTLWQKGKDILQGMWNGAQEVIILIATWFRDLPGKVVTWIGDLLETLLQVGKDLLQGLWDGAKATWTLATDWLGGLAGTVVNFVTGLGDSLIDVGKKVINGLWDGMKSAWETVKGWLSNLNPANWFNDINPYKGHAIKNLNPTGKTVFKGLQNGMESGWNETTTWLRGIDPSSELDPKMSRKFTDKINKTLDLISKASEMAIDVNPTITPVLDLTNLQKGAGYIRGIFDSGASMSADVSYSRADSILTTSRENDEFDNIVAPIAQQPTQIKFEQNNYSPTSLSAGDIYRNTRSQIAMAKEELAVL